MGQWAEREARQQTASVFTDLQRTDAPTGRAVGCMLWVSREGAGGFNVLTFSVEPGLSRSNSLHKTTPSFRELWRNASGSEMVFFGDSSTPSVINHVTVCSAEFMSSRNRSLFQNSGCVWFFNSLPNWLRCHLRVKERNTVNPKKACGRWKIEGKGGEAAENPPPQGGCGWRRADGNSVGLFPPWNGVFSTWQAVNCASLWCADAQDCIHAHRSQQPFIRWMTSHRRDKPLWAVVSALQHDMNSLCLGLYICSCSFFLYRFIINKPRAMGRFFNTQEESSCANRERCI